MDKKDLLNLYNQEYAEVYTASFLTAENFVECTQYEVSVIRDLLSEGSNWLDAACGTGYILHQFPTIYRSGFDASPAMLKVAHDLDPSLTLYEHDFRNVRDEWKGKWDLISCMWYAYCYANTAAEIERVISNFTTWLSAHGTLFLPFCDPNVLTKLTIPHQPPADSDDGSLTIDAVIWTWTDEPSGRVHENLVAPTRQWMTRTLQHYFMDVELVRYPTFGMDCLKTRAAFIARNKR
jgi:Methyltransferase domain